MPNHREIIEFIFIKMKSEIEGNSLAKELEAKFGLTGEDAEKAILMYNTAAFRVAFDRIGLTYPKSNVDGDPFLIEATKIISEWG